MTDWMPIASAPMDGTLIRVMAGGAHTIGSWSHDLKAWVTGRASDVQNLVERVLPWEPHYWAPLDL